MNKGLLKALAGTGLLGTGYFGIPAFNRKYVKDVLVPLRDNDAAEDKDLGGKFFSLLKDKLYKDDVDHILRPSPTVTDFFGRKVDGTKMILSSSESPAILSHEYGHSLQDPKDLGEANLLRFLSSAPVFLGAFNRKTALAGGLLGTLMRGKLVSTEYDASRRGMNTLLEMGQDEDKAKRAFGGVPTYAADALAPLLEGGGIHLLYSALRHAKR